MKEVTALARTDTVKHGHGTDRSSDTRNCLRNEPGLFGTTARRATIRIPSGCQTESSSGLVGRGPVIAVGAVRAVSVSDRLVRANVLWFSTILSH